MSEKRLKEIEELLELRAIYHKAIGYGGWTTEEQMLAELHDNYLLLKKENEEIKKRLGDDSHD